MTLDSRNSKVGLDIGTSAVKIVAVSGLPGKPVLSAVGVRAINGLSRKEIAESIKDLALESKISSKHVNISVSGPQLVVRFVTMPQMDAAALKGAMKFEAEKYIPFDINDCIVDFQTLEKNDKENKLNILLVAVKKEHVLSRIRLVEEAGFSVDLVDVDSFALANAFLKNFPNIAAEKTAALLNIGGSCTNLCILKGQAICFARDISVGGNDFNAAISKKSGIDQKESEALKILPAEKADDVTNCVKNVLTGLLDEVKLSFNYYENQGGKGIEEIYISGGSSSVIGLDESISETFGPVPSVWNPLQALAPADEANDLPDRVKGSLCLPDKIKSSFCVAAGLALR